MSVRRLAVELDGTIVGTLEGETRTFDFTPTSEGIERFGANSTALSVSVPLAPVQSRTLAGRRRNWFAELLPEGDQYEYMLRQAGLRRGDTLAFLARYGRDVAGALQIWDIDDPNEPLTPPVRPVTATAVRALLDDPLGAPLANDATRGKSSLGGVQPKIVLVCTKDGWAQALGGYPTTHILKPQLGGGRETVIYDEEYGLRIARHLGLASFGTSIETFDGRATLVIERFDRSPRGRVHQEDFSQVLGATGDQKYQSIGGAVSLKRVAGVMRKELSHRDLVKLARMVTFAVAIGNLDMHTKNIGLLHPIGGDVALAPAYDVVPQADLSGNGELALAVNRKYRHADVSRDDLVAEFAGWGVREGRVIVDETLESLDAVVVEELPVEGARPFLHEEILGFVRRLRDGHPVGRRMK